MNKDSVSATEETNERKTGRDIVDQVDARATKMKKAGINVIEEVGAFVRQQPVATIGIAVGTGFLLGAVLGNRIGRVALVAAVGYAAQELVEGVLGAGGVRKLVVDEVSKLAVSKLAKSDKIAS